ncbi:hypothetical protein FXV77_12830 [Sphingobacterium phlebotomi]|uniref:Concanavalin A-like lectin/glucanase superfamily protein n=1 Tax=Sphingobacterium phlebotomi TaxID=2605433 RepID=A0A5D4H831_9SPHI|nr:DUF4998 domain-containing protein [Sphingobacterium phlebotomi]TYR35595.1 hypothetical protein FXV77_12830 [Sphingobacterium phlebotomi]
MKNTIKYIFRISLILPLFFSCDRMNDFHDEYLQRGETTYLSRINEVKVYPGNKRAELVFVNNDSKAKAMTVYWRSRTDSVVYTIPDNSVGQELKIQLPDLPEDFLTFELVTTTADGKNKSLATELSSRVYGDNYRESINNRLVDVATYVESSNQLDITWKSVFEGAVKIELEYDGADGDTRVIELPIEERSIVYLNRFDGNLKYRTGYVPVQNALDTFYTAYSDLEFSEAIEGLVFNGTTSQYMLIPHHADFDIAAGEAMTVTCWARTPTIAATQRIFAKRYTATNAPGYGEYGNTGYGLAFLGSTGNIYPDLVYQGATQAINMPSISVNTWTHIAAVFDIVNKQMFVYKDGVLLGSRALPATVLSTTNIADLSVGGHKSSSTGGVGQAFTGEIARLRFYKKTLSPEEIIGDMLSVRVTAETPGLVAAYDLKKVLGSGTNLTIEDIKGNHLAVLHGFSRP